MLIPTFRRSGINSGEPDAVFMSDFGCLKRQTVENKYFILRFVWYGSRDLSEHVIRPHVNKIDSVDEC